MGIGPRETRRAGQNAADQSVNAFCLIQAFLYLMICCASPCRQPRTVDMASCVMTIRSVACACSAKIASMASTFSLARQEFARPNASMPDSEITRAQRVQTPAQTDR